jgi:sugar phosphate isomerase/epimerase
MRELKYGNVASNQRQQLWKLAAYARSLHDLEDLSRNGFKYVSLHPILFSTATSKSVDMGGIPDDEIIGRVKKAVGQNGLEPVDFQTFGAWGLLGCSGVIGQIPASPDDPMYEEVRQKGVRQFAKLVKVCKALGCNQMTAELGGSPIFHLDHEEAWMKSVQDLAPVLREEDVRLAFLPHPGDFLEESNPVVDMIRATKSKEVGYLYCVPHTFVLAGRYNADISAMIEYGADILMAVQVADALKPIQMWLYQHREINKNHSHLLPGKGMVDIKGALRALKALGYTGPLILIPYRYGMYPKSFSDLALEAKQTIDKMTEEI